ncbi:MAG: energy-coupling factor transporter transmembrane protein EcfT [Spirochaetaceae bacterium]|jgi:cobalt/nickel transport system permease protein|nr:energy-coupling factor transporter transmembrane protein EcfT [Spirochaetaceae bacterium]
MYLDKLEYKKDFLRSIDGRCRFISAALLLTAAVYTTSLTALSTMAVCCLLLLSRELRVTALRLLAVNTLMLAVWISTLFGLSPRSAVFYTLRLNAAALVYMSLIIPMSISELASSMAKLKIPEKLISLFILTYRYIFLMSGRLSTALVSMRLRSPENGTFYMWRSFAAVFASTMTAAVFRSRRVSLAMISRGFNGAFPITRVFKWRTRDTVFLTLCVVISSFMILQ